MYEDYKSRPLFSVRGFMLNPNRREAADGTDAHELGVVISELYKETREKAQKTTSWAFRKEVLRIAMLMFRDFNQWVRSNSYEGYLYGRRYDFLMDTIRFIKTGKRDLSVTNWKELLEEHIPPNKREANQLDISQLIFQPTIKTSELISMWCSQEKGFVDMLCTLDILFGVSRGTDLPEFTKPGLITAKPL